MGRLNRRQRSGRPFAIASCATRSFGDAHDSLAATRACRASARRRWTADGKYDVMMESGDVRSPGPSNVPLRLATTMQRRSVEVVLGSVRRGRDKLLLAPILDRVGARAFPEAAGHLDPDVAVDRVRGLLREHFLN